MIRFASLYLIASALACFGQTTIGLHGPDGQERQYTLKGHPRLWMDGPEGPITRSIQDPDGGGPQRSAKASGPLWDALRKRLENLKPKAATDLTGLTALMSALAWFMDNNATFNDGTPYRSMAIDQIKTVHDVWVGLGACDKAANFCGTTTLYPGTHVSYMGNLLSYWSLAYTLIRSELTPEERHAFAEKLLNGITKDIGGNCENRYERLPGVLRVQSSNGTYTAGLESGGHWDYDVTGQWIYVKNPLTPTGAGIFLRVSSSGDGRFRVEKPATSSFLNIPLHAYRIKPWASGQCGMGYVANHHGNTPTYAVTYAAMKSTNSISELDTTLNVENTAGLPAFVPFYVRVGPSGAFELMKVTAVNGKSLTVSRGEFSTAAKSWVTASPVVYQSHTGPGDPMGWNNRTVTRQVGHVMAAIALADDDPRALDLLKTTTDFWNTNTWFAANNYFTFMNTAATSYGLSREIPFFLWTVQSYYSSFTPALDYRGEWIKWAGADFFFHWTTPWDKKSLINFGIAADNCQGLGSSVEIQCSGATVFLQSLYPGTPSAQRAWDWVDHQGLVNDFGRLVTPSGERLLLPLILYTDGSLSKTDYAGDSPTHFVGNKTGDTSGQGKNFSAFSSRTNWGENASLLYVLAPDKLTKEYPKIVLSEKVQDDLLGEYGIGRKGWFLGQVNDGYWTRYLGLENAVDFGPICYGALNPYSDLEMDKQLSDEKSNFLYVRTDVKKGYSSLHQVTHGYRHFAHFKAPGTNEAIVVYDDFASEKSQRIRGMLHYLNNGQSKMGQTYVDEKASLITSDNTQAKLFTNLVKVGGAGMVTDLNVAWKANTATVGTYCSSSDPCRAKVGDTVFSFTAPANVTITPTDSGASEVFIWLNTSDGKIYAAGNQAGVSCDGDIDCSGTATSFPDGAISLARLVYKAGKAASYCPGPIAGKKGAEYHNCVGGDQRHVFLDAGSNVTAAEFLVVHQPTDLGGSPDEATELTQIDPNFTGVQIKGANSKVAMFGRGGIGYGSASMTTDHEGTGRYLIAGLAPGKYDIQKDGTGLISGVYVTTESEALAFESEHGSFSIVRVGDAAPLTLIGASLPPVEVGDPYGSSVSADGGAPPYSWSIQSGQLPSGMTLSVTSGMVSGIATEIGNYPFTLQVADSQGNTLSLPLILQVQPLDNALTITTDTLATGVVRQEYSSTPSGFGGVGPYSWGITAGDLPAGLTLDSQTGEIKGTPSEAGSKSITITMTDSTGGSVSKDIVIEIAGPAITQ